MNRRLYLGGGVGGTEPSVDEPVGRVIFEDNPNVARVEGNVGGVLPDHGLTSEVVDASEEHGVLLDGWLAGCGRW